VLGLRLPVSSALTMQTAAARVVALRLAGWRTEWSPVGSYLDVVAECRP